MKIITGKAKVKDDSTYIYKGHTLEVTGVYIEYKNGNGHGIYADGSREYKVSLIGTPFEEKYKATVIHDKHLENLELYQEVVLPLDEKETLELLQYANTCDMSTDEEILINFLNSQKKRHIPPVHDLSTIYDEEEWQRRNPDVKITKTKAGTLYQTITPEEKEQTLLDEFKSLFPLKGIVTQEIIENANLYVTTQCIGALTIKNALPEKFRTHITWARHDGHVIVDEQSFGIKTVDRVDMMEIKEPTEVTFILKEQ